MPAFGKTEPRIPERGAFDLEEYGLRVNADGDRVSAVYRPFEQRVYEGDRDGFLRLVLLLDAERDRAAREIVEDAERGLVRAEGTHGMCDLEETVDSNLYVSGARSIDGGFGDELHEWSDRKLARHLAALLGHGVIGAGVETVDPQDPAASESLTGFEGAVATALDRWLGEGGLAAAFRPNL